VEAVTGQTTSLDAVREFGSAAERFADTVAECDLRATVAACAPWSAHDLVVHLGNTHAWAATVVETGKAAAEQDDKPSSSRSRAVSRWYLAKAEDLYQVLRHAAPSAPCWNFVLGSGVAAFWQRRQLHETTIHQVDLDLTLGRSTRLKPAVCVDGIGEVLEAMMVRMHRRGHPADLTRPVALVASDTGGGWLLTPSGRGEAGTKVVPLQAAGGEAGVPPTVTRVDRAPDSVDAVEAPADVLYRLLWHRRVPPGAVHVTGDQDRVQAFLRSRLTP
jgi:uncharacterized protein (TIGR03083 family)